MLSLIWDKKNLSAREVRKYFPMILGCEYEGLKHVSKHVYPPPYLPTILGIVHVENRFSVSATSERQVVYVFKRA
jgi:hypothetical protein